MLARIVQYVRACVRTYVVKSIDIAALRDSSDSGAIVSAWHPCDARAFCKRYDASRRLWLNATGTGPAVAVGETFRNPDLADTYELVAADGSGEESFYGGALGEEIVAAVQVRACVCDCRRLLLLLPPLPMCGILPSLFIPT
jgi:hypothetical protein